MLCAEANRLAHNSKEQIVFRIMINLMALFDNKHETSVGENLNRY